MFKPLLPPAVPTAGGCDVPKHVLHGKAQERNLTTGRAVEVQCDKGYDLVGEPLVVCIGGNAWSSAFPTCQRERRNLQTKQAFKDDTTSLLLSSAAKLCPPPPGWRDNGGRSDFRVGQSVRVTCPRGHEVKGSGTITCRPDQTWSLISSVCESR